MKNLLLIVLVCLGILAEAFAQTFSIPAYQFKTAEDYPRYEQQIIDAYYWMLTTPAAEQGPKRPAVEKFIMEWSMGTPTVDVVIDNMLGSIFTGQPELTMICLGGYATHVLEARKAAGVLNTAQKLEAGVFRIVDATYAAIRNAADYCERNKITPQKALKGYLKMDKKGELKAHIEQNLKAQMQQ